MKKFLKLALALLPIGKEAAKQVKNAKDKHEKKKIRKAIRRHALDELRKLVLRDLP